MLSTPRSAIRPISPRGCRRWPRWARSQTGWKVLETFSISHGKASAYLPVIDLLRNYFEILAEDDERKRREKVAGKIVMLDRALEDTIAYLFALLGISEGDDPLAQM